MSPTIRLPEVIGLTILHSLWQITLLWFILVSVLKIWPKASSALHYTLAISTLILSVVLTTAIGVYEWQHQATRGEIPVLLVSETSKVHTGYIAVNRTLLSTIIESLNFCAPVLAWLWCAGIIVMAARFGGSMFYLRKLRAQKNITPISAVWKNKLHLLSEAIGVKCKVAIAMSGRISSPITLGSISPIILLPAGFLSGLSTAQVESILVHELYHIKRQDYFINICQVVIEVLLFYHPAIWHINKLIREERENCCDDKTIAFCGDTLAYARALTQIHELSTLNKPSLAISANGANFSNRIKRLFNMYPNHSHARSKGMLAIGVLLVYVCVVLASANVSTAQPAAAKEPVTPGRTENNSNIFAGSNPIINPPNLTEAKSKTHRRKSSAVSTVVQSAEIELTTTDSITSEQSLEKCLQKVRLLLKMASLYQQPRERFNFTRFSLPDSIGLRPSMFYGTLNQSRTEKLELMAGTQSQATNKEPPKAATYAAASDIVDVQVFPNATYGILNISFTPLHDNSRVKLVLVNSDGTVVTEITDSTYNNSPAALQVDLSGYKKGIYILQIDIDGVKSQQRVVVD